jgi:Protein kinase domain
MSATDRWTELSQGDEFAGYRIERALGRGGMGVLYLAMEPGLDRRVALKLIAPEAADDEVFARRFAEESKIAASIEHPNVVPIYAAGEENGVPYIAMRYVSGSDLGRRTRHEGRLDPEMAVALIAQVGNGLDAIHAAGLVHRDVKPANVLLSGQAGGEHAYITDFGVARNVATDSGLTQTGRFVGTLDYVAPEQISGGEVDARADVYALGCLLFKLLTGDVPFPGDSEAARLYAHLNEPPPAPSLRVEGVPMPLDDVAIRAMSKVPQDRYPSAGDLGRAAAAALHGEQPTVPERTVATGAAATREAPVTTTAGATKAAGGPIDPTRRVGPEWRARRPPRRLLLAGGLLGGAALIAAAAIALGGGGSGGGDTGAGARNAAAKGIGAAGGGSASQPLSKSELVRRADEICAESQGTFRQVREEFPEAREEEAPDVAYSETLVGISTPAVKKLRALDPPASARVVYEEYVQAQARVKAYDRQALKAAKAGDTSAYVRARELRDNEQLLRHELAQDIGLEVCSASAG